MRFKFLIQSIKNLALQIPHVHAEILVLANEHIQAKNTRFNLQLSSILDADSRIEVGDER